MRHYRSASGVKLRMTVLEASFNPFRHDGIEIRGKGGLESSPHFSAWMIRPSAAPCVLARQGLIYDQGLVTFIAEAPIV